MTDKLPECPECHAPMTGEYCVCGHKLDVDDMLRQGKDIDEIFSEMFGGKK